ncbi:MAG: ABC transporter ATP-binding protein [Kiritimatiellae bacterium]|nr:ABC transporter ATP-binding protein [Kiritimatiellia bacterium]
MNAIDVKDLNKKFGSKEALKNVSFSVKQGERVAIVGQNGAGKTTLLRILSTYLPANSGTVQVLGFDAVKDALQIRSNIGYLPEAVPLYEEMRVFEYLKFKCKLRHMPTPTRRRRLHEVISCCDLVACTNSTISSLSQGIKQRVGLADAIVHEPHLLMIDSLFSNCDPYQIESFSKLLLKNEVLGSATLLFSSHNREVISSIATRVIFLNHGEIVADTTDVEQLKQHTLSELFNKWIRQKDASEE